MAGIFPPQNKNGVPPSANVCNGYTPEHRVVGEGPLYYSADCTTVLTDCALNAMISEILAAVDALGYPFNADRVTNLGDALRAWLEQFYGAVDDRVKRAGDWMEGPLHQPADPVEWSELGNKRYIDAQDAATAAQVIAHLTQLLEAMRAILQANIDLKVSRSGDQMTGPLIASRHPEEDYEFATKRYVDDNSSTVLFGVDAPDAGPGRLWWQNSTGGFFLRYRDENGTEQWVCLGGGGGGGMGGLDFVPTFGGTMTGPLTLFGDPTEPLHAVTKEYLDSAIALGFVDAPEDDLVYGRRNGEWVELTPSMFDVDGGTF